ncbi:glycosyltransferase family 2 protein [Polynucleobacter sp. AP-Capit-er-40B-B4]|uniref:glycosyltransferase family 2 protein n=1 Tax=Polynucleobacter sp. AP-Capit-er-40B-B4 TaxID=2576927 RepID=UPI001C0E1B6A|nr:glycosyltransferase family 2 protein [Polynucleobacter sp. AP-Capit-er-40B-B4]MBU3580975.1 glycosyltransferase family 2 protein [Polynucleobacter sp. AP-Capit-er-40B-B4]
MISDVCHAPISVIIPCYRASSTLQRAVQSILDQTQLPMELIMVDDASPDNGKTKFIISTLEKMIYRRNLGISVKAIFLNSNIGPGGARNIGWARATQPWIAFLDADDAWAVNKIALQYGLLKKIEGIDLIAHQSILIPEINFLPRQSLVKNCRLKRISLSQMLISNSIPTRSVILRKDIPYRFPNGHFSEDFSLWLSIISAGYDVRIMDCPLAYTFRPEFSGDGYSSQLWRQQKRELFTLYDLRRRGGINFYVLTIVCIWSIIKFFRRIITRGFFKTIASARKNLFNE